MNDQYYDVEKKVNHIYRLYYKGRSAGVYSVKFTCLVSETGSVESKGLPAVQVEIFPS